MSLLAYWRHLWDRGAWWFQRKRRDEPPFKLWVGKRGRGKSLRLTFEIQKILRRIRIREDGTPDTVVLSNYPVYDPRSDTSAELWLDLEQLMGRVARAVEADQLCIVGIDEAQNIFDAREWEKTPRWFRSFLSESRHYKVGILAATQQLSMVEKRFRSLCDEIIRVRPVIEGFHHRVALFRMCKLEEDFDSVDEEAKELGIAWLSWIPASAYVGYRTAALPSDESVASVSDTAAIEKLIARSRALVSQ